MNRFVALQLSRCGEFLWTLFTSKPISRRCTLLRMLRSFVFIVVPFSFESRLAASTTVYEIIIRISHQLASCNKFDVLERFFRCSLFPFLWWFRFTRSCGFNDFIRFRAAGIHFVFVDHVIIILVILLLTVHFKPGFYFLVVKIDWLHIDFDGIFVRLDIYKLSINDSIFQSLQSLQWHWPFFVSLFTERICRLRSLIATFSSKSSVSVAWSSLNDEHFCNRRGTIMIAALGV